VSHILLTVRKLKALLMPAASLRVSAAAIEAYTAAILKSTALRSKVKEGNEIGESGVREYGGGKGKW
jgi:hypothetical protein